jgi:hypothetical protein
MIIALPKGLKHLTAYGYQENLSLMSNGFGNFSTRLRENLPLFYLLKVLANQN